MPSEKMIINIDGVDHEVLHLLGDGMCTCRECDRNHRWSLSWTSFFYKITEDGEPLCYNCLKEKLMEGEKNG